MLLPLLLTLAAPQDGLTEGHLEALRWRNIGPTQMGGRVIDLAVDPDTPRVFYVASASGGLFKTTNNGTTFEPVFDSYGSSSVGAVALAPSDPQVVYVGTGEANARNSVSWGDGVYRTTDGGETWSHLGLERTKHIGGLAVSPADADTAFVAAMGSTWGRNPERGLYRTTDGGGTWEQVLYVDDQTGCIDVRIDPGDPQIVYAATYQRQRDEFDSNDPAIATGPGSGLWRSLDGGTTWARLSEGLPTVDIGRIGMDIHGADPRILYAIVETERGGERGAPPRSTERVSLGIRGADAQDGGFDVQRVTEGESAHQAGILVGDVIVRVDATDVAGRGDLVAALRGYAPGDQAQLVLVRGGEEETATLNLLGRLEGGGARSFAGSQGGQVGGAQDEQGAEGFETGGVFRSDDRGETWARVNSLNPRPFYYSQIRVDPSDDQHVYVLGISLHRSKDGGKTFRTTGGGVHPDHHAMWIDPQDGEHVVLGNDGGVYVTWDDSSTWDHLDVLPLAQFYNVAVDTRTPYWVYGGLQDNGSWGGPSATRGRGIATDDWIKTNGGDGFRCAVDPRDPDIVYSESQNGMIVRRNLRTGDTRRVTQPGRGTRFNWNTPYFLSPHNASILYYAGNHVYRSIDDGESSARISDEITRTDRGSATALGQSPLDADLLYVGTDDGALWRTTDGGASWEDIAPGLDLEQPLYVADIEPSPHRADTVYLALDGHRSDDYAPHLLVSRDAGDSWRSLSDGLPAGGPVRTVAVDPRSRDLLFCGTEFGCFTSIDAGESWARLESGLPRVPIHDLVIQDDAADLVAGTHGRGVWIVDIAPLRGLEPDHLSAAATLLPVAPARAWSSTVEGEPSGARRFLGTNPERGAQVYYVLGEEVGRRVRLTVRDATGRELAQLQGPGTPGLHRVTWNLRRGGERGRGGFGRGGFGRSAGVATGTYSVTLEVGDDPPVRAVQVLPDPRDLGSEGATQRR